MPPPCQAPAERRASFVSLKIAVTCISRLESIQLADLDADRYGLIVRGRTHPWQIGAALPNTPDRESEAQQYRECLRKAGLRTDARHDLYRFSVTRRFRRTRLGSRTVFRPSPRRSRLTSLTICAAERRRSSTAVVSRG